MRAPTPPRSPWQLFYGAAHALRRWWWSSRAARLPRPVVSVGNLHWGGAGKTPLTAAVAGHLRDRGLAVAVLSRGYGGKGEGVRVVSTGEGPLLGPKVAGDEPVLLAGELPGVAVLVGRDRYRAGRHALERLDPVPDVLILDDGFSHLRLARDLDLLAFPAADPFAGGRLPPAGRLREPLASAAHADAAILTGGDGAGAAELADALRRFGFTGPAFVSRTRPLAVETDRHEPLAPGTKVLLVSGIARPRRFLDAVASLPFVVLDALEFPDHHAYPAGSVRRIEAALERTGAEAILTTAKDQVKLLGRLDATLAVLPVRAEPEPGFWRWLDGRLDAVRGGAHG